MESFAEYGGAVALVAFSLSSLLGGYIYLWNTYSYWSRRGIPGPKPKPFAGNVLDFFIGNKRDRLEREWIKEYGKVYGIYHGTKPRLVIADPELLNQICIKDFDHFTDHDVNEFSNKYQKNFLFTQKGDHWKKVRALTSPTFTSGKIRRMFRFLDICADDLIECVREQLPADSGETVVNVKDIYNLYAMDAIATCCYAIKLERKGSSNLSSAASRDEFVKAAMGFSSIDFTRIMTALVLPKPILRLIGFHTKPESVLEPMVRRATSIIESRRKSGRKYDDYLQMLLDAELNQELELTETDTHEDHHAGLDSNSVLDDQRRMVHEVESKFGQQQSRGRTGQVRLTDLEIVSGSIFLLSVGLDTTGSLLSSATYLLAFHQEVQERLYQEMVGIVEAKERGHSFEYEALTAAKYLDAVLAETLRYMSPVLALDRRANKDYYLQKYNLLLPEGSVVNLAFHAIMNDPDNFEEPRKFDPERFMPGRRENIKPGAYCPFGVGPRHCIGMRFSLTEAKLAIAKLMMNFRFQPAPNTSFPPEPEVRFVLHSVRKPFVKFVVRDSSSS